jgi:hypothetical protein
MFFKIPAAWWSGVRLHELTETLAITRVRHRWVNQNPFNSMFWAVQGMAAEFASGALAIHHIRRSGKPVSMLVINNRANFSKKAKGVITFTCDQGEAIRGAIDKAIETGEGQTLWMRSVGLNSEGETVSAFEFEWSFKLKQAL